MNEYVIGIDAGTSDLRAVVFGRSGEEIAQARAPYETSYPDGGWAEQDACDWARALESALRTLIQDRGVAPESVKAIGITHQRETIVPVDPSGAPLRKAILWFDNRSAGQAEWIKGQVNPNEVMRITGVPASHAFSLAKILWIKDNQREIFEKAHKFLLVSDFLTYLATGNFATSWASACTTQLFDINSFGWSGHLLDICGIPAEKMPESVAPGQPLGKISRKFAAATSIPEGTPLIACGGDQQCGALGTGVVRPGTASLNLGTSIILETSLNAPVMDPRCRYWLRLACVPGKYAAENGILGGGYTLKWFRENFGRIQADEGKQPQAESYEALTLEAAKAPPGSLGLMLVPYWLGVLSPYNDPAARGIVAGFTGLHRREHFIRSILEGVAYEVRLNLENMEEASGGRIEEIRAYGGGAKSALWCQIISDICNKRVVVTQTEENTALGAAILAAAGAFHAGSIDAAVGDMIHQTAEYRPSRENVAIYDRYYNNIYKSLYPSLRPLFREFQF